MIGSLAAIDDRSVVVPVAIAVVIFLDDDGFAVSVPVLVAITDIPAVTIPVAVPIMPGADGYPFGPTPTPISSALAGMATQMPATAAIIKAHFMMFSNIVEIRCLDN